MGAWLGSYAQWAERLKLDGGADIDDVSVDLKSQVLHGVIVQPTMGAGKTMRRLPRSGSRDDLQEEGAEVSGLLFADPRDFEQASAVHRASGGELGERSVVTDQVGGDAAL